MLRPGERVDEEGLCPAPLDAGVVVHPGFFLDFERNGHLVMSLMVDPSVLAEGLERRAQGTAPKG